MKNKGVKSIPIDSTERLWDYVYKTEDKLMKLISYLESCELDGCKKKILELISGRSPY